MVLLAILLPALTAGSPELFAVLTLLLVCAAGWEWGRLNGLRFYAALGEGGLLAAAGLVALGTGWALNPPIQGWWASSAVWTLVSLVALRGGPPVWRRIPQWVRLVVGLLMLWVAWLAMVSAKVLGVDFILSVFSIVWMADMSAYFGGRAFGKHKLAPSISPGKTWEGVVSAVFGVALLAISWLMLDRSTPSNVFAVLFDRLGLVGLVLSLVALTALSVVGDLVESLVKRAAGAKDSSALLPGHGGVLDRVDALLPVFPAALALISL